jgi:hypothetical protein
MVGVPVHFEFGPVWDGLIKAAVFQGSGASVTVMLFRTNEAEVPFEVLMAAGSTLKIGVEGRDPEGGLVIPSTMVEVGKILEGADPTGTEPAEATSPVWEQIMEKVDALEALTEDFVDQADLEAAFMSHKNDPNDHPELRDTIRSVSDDCMQNYVECVRSVNGVGPDEGGNVNVNAGSDIIVDAELDKTSHNPVENKAVAVKIADLEKAFALSLEALEEEIPTDSYIIALIDTQLGVIENGTY